MERKKYLVVTAGGTGTRMGSAVPKQFLELDGVPILRRTIEVFLKAVPDIQVITVLPEGHVAYWRQYCLQANFVCPQRLVKGGFTRFHSVKNALKLDKVRELFKAAESAPAVIPVMPVTDTLKVLEKRGGVLAATGETVDRSRIYGAQTPQVFQSEALKAAYTLQFDTSFTDDASVAERHGLALTFLPGERFNLKITTPEDLILARAIIDSSLRSE